MLQHFTRPLRRFLDLLIPIAMVLLILFLIVRSWSINHVSKEDLAAEVASAEVQDLGAIANFSCQNGSETLVFTRKDDGKWYWIDETFPLDQEAVTEFVTVLSSFKPSVVVADGENLNLDDYDLSTPLYTIQYATVGGDSTTYHFGKSIDSGGTYMKVGTNNATVYMAPSNLSSLVKKGLYDFCLTDSFPALSAENVSKITLSTADRETLYVRRFDDEGASSARWFSGGRDVTENGAFLTVIDELSTLCFDTCLVWNPVADSFGICGLNEPRLTLTLEYTDLNQRECTLELHIGDARSDTEYFAGWSAKNAIYSIHKDRVDGLLAAANAN